MYDFDARASESITDGVSVSIYVQFDAIEGGFGIII